MPRLFLLLLAGNFDGFGMKLGGSMAEVLRDGDVADDQQERPCFSPQCFDCLRSTRATPYNIPVADGTSRPF